MLSAGVLLSEETEFGDLLIRINHDAVKWKATSDVEIGDRSLVSHVQWRKPSQHPKLSLMMHLCSRGWQPTLKGPAAGYYSAGDERHFLRWGVARRRTSQFFAKRMKFCSASPFQMSPSL